MGIARPTQGCGLLLHVGRVAVVCVPWTCRTQLLHASLLVLSEDCAGALRVADQLTSEVRSLVRSQVVPLLVLVQALVDTCARVEDVPVVAHRMQHVTEKSMNLGCVQVLQDGGGVKEDELLRLLCDSGALRERHWRRRSGAKVSRDAANEQGVLSHHCSHVRMHRSVWKSCPIPCPVKIIAAFGPVAFLTIDELGVRASCSFVADGLTMPVAK
ncbi:hypothetical protein I4F81_003191 [Pyropia yezoensis]|uniref:Uncharacterized protein n=1 Tax=Pyropia yezoensis TaxID=2788 RepID=A0ACC3BRP2_PYRYE|nr:hypothetical protein I4F81_003191 [Neopyropia yezoensis]